MSTPIRAMMASSRIDPVNYAFNNDHGPIDDQSKIDRSQAHQVS